MIVDEQATYIDVWMDGAKARFWYDRTDGSSDHIEFFDSGDAEFAKSRTMIKDGGVEYGVHRNNFMQIVENTPNRVLLRLIGEIHRTDTGVVHSALAR